MLHRKYSITSPALPPTPSNTAAGNTVSPLPGTSRWPARQKQAAGIKCFQATFPRFPVSKCKLPAPLNNSLYIPQTSRFSQAIQAFWQMERGTPFHREIIVPKGVVEIIFNLNDHSPILSQIGGNEYSVPDSFINGFNTRPIQLQPPERQAFFGVQFQPLTVKEIFGAIASEFSNSLVDLTLLDPAFRSLRHRLAEQSSFEARIAAFLHWLEKRFSEPEPRENLMNNFLTGASRHDISVTALADSLCYSSWRYGNQWPTWILYPATGSRIILGSKMPALTTVTLGRGAALKSLISTIGITR